MKICLLAPCYMNLHKPILYELKRQGHEVVFVEDKMFDFDWKYPYRSLADRFVRRMKCCLCRHFTNYWKSVFAMRQDLNQAFDELIVVNGCSVNDYFMRKMLQANKALKKVLYLWDNSSFYDYFHNRYLFDKVMTYDLDDSIRYKAQFLPFYWLKLVGGGKNLITYKLTMIGSNHSGRLKIGREIARQLRSVGMPYFIKILDNTIPEDDLVTHELISPARVNQIIAESDCVLDTDRETQTGTTPRLIWALAQGKKIVTTNQNIRRMPFYDSERICIIDRNNPVLDVSFLRKDVKGKSVSQYIMSLRIDKWVRNFII